MVLAPVLIIRRQPVSFELEAAFPGMRRGSLWEIITWEGFLTFRITKHSNEFLRHSSPHSTNMCGGSGLTAEHWG